MEEQPENGPKNVKQTMDVSLTKKEKKDILNQVFDNGFYSKKIDSINIPGDKKKVVTLKNLSVEDQMEVEKAVSEEKGNAAYILHKYSFLILSKTIVSIGEESKNEGSNSPLDSEEKRIKFLNKLPTPLIDKLLKEQRKLEGELQAALGVDVISENFSPEVDQLLDSEESQGESTSEKEEA